MCSLLVFFGIVLSVIMDVNAEKTGSADIIVDGSLLTHDDFSISAMTDLMIRGTHLMDGESGISKVGNGRIYVYGQTTANHKVDFVAVLMYVERYLKDTDGWGAVAAYSEDARDKYYVISDDTMKVDGGYYYRVHCEHFAGNDDEDMYDSAISYTDGIWIP